MKTKPQYQEGSGNMWLAKTGLKKLQKKVQTVETEIAKGQNGEQRKGSLKPSKKKDSRSGGSKRRKTWKKRGGCVFDYKNNTPSKGVRKKTNREVWVGERYRTNGKGKKEEEVRGGKTGKTIKWGFEAKENVEDRGGALPR